MTDQSTRVVPAGWYEDPDDGGLVRWWNGLGWTEHTEAKPAEVTPAAAAPVEEVAPVATTPAIGLGFQGGYFAQQYRVDS